MTAKELISKEVTAQLIELKIQLNKEFAQDLQELRRSILADVKLLISQNTPITPITTAKNEPKNDPTQQFNQLAIIQTVEKSTKELIIAAENRVADRVTARLKKEIDEKVMPKVNNMVSMMNYHTEDTAAVVDSYRRQVEIEDRKLLTNGKKNNTTITPHVRTMFEYDGDDF